MPCYVLSTICCTCTRHALHCMYCLTRHSLVGPTQAYRVASMIFENQERAAAAAAVVMAAAMVWALRLTSMAMARIIGVVLRARDCDEIGNATNDNDGDTHSEGDKNSEVMTVDNDGDTNSDGDTSSDEDTDSDAGTGNNVNWYRRYVNTLNPIEIALSYEYWQEVEDRQDVLTGHAIIMLEPRGTWFTELHECGKHVSRLRNDDLLMAATNFARFLAAARRENIEETFGDRLRLVQLACLMRAVNSHSPVPGATHELYCFLVEQGEDLPEILHLQQELGQLLKFRSGSPTPASFVEMFLDNALHHNEFTEDQALHIRRRAADAAWRLTKNGWLATMGASQLAQVSLMWVERELVQAGFPLSD